MYNFLEIIIVYGILSQKYEKYELKVLTTKNYFDTDLIFFLLTKRQNILVDVLWLRLIPFGCF